MTTSDIYHGKYARIVIKDDTETDTYIDNSSTPVNARGIDITVDQTIDELFGQDSILRQGVVRTEVHCKVSVKYVKADGALIANMLGTQTADTDIDGGASAGRTRGVINDTPDLNLYNLWSTVTHGSNILKAKITNVAFTTFPIIAAPENGWVEFNLEGSGKAVFTEYDT